MSYQMDLAAEVARGDEVIDAHGVRVLVDPKAVMYLLGSEMDFIVDKLSAVHKELATDEALQKRFLAAGARMLHTTPAETKAFATKETKMWQEVVRLSGLTPQ